MRALEKLISNVNRKFSYSFVCVLSIFTNEFLWLIILTIDGSSSFLPQAKSHDLVMPVIKSETQEEYLGGHVIEPQRGFVQTTPITTPTHFS